MADPVDEQHRKLGLSAGSVGFQLSFEQLSVAMIITRIDGTTQVNEALCRLVRRTREEIAAIEIATLFHLDDRPGDFEYGTRALAGEIDGWTREKRLLRSALVGDHGDTPIVSLWLVAHRDARGEIECYSAITRDISELKHAQELLRTQAATDVLTGLPNRCDFSDRLGRALARTVRTGDGVAVLFVDLDRFKSVNDCWGHAAGDELLVQVAQRLTGVIRTGDTVARVGGDEFVVLAEPVHRPDDARIMGERIVQAIAEPFELREGTVGIGASVGLAMNAPHSTPRSIVHAADLPSMKAKSTGRSRLVLAEPEADVPGSADVVPGPG